MKSNIGLCISSLTSIISGSAAPIICRSIILVKSFIRRLPRQRLMKCLKIPKQTLLFMHVHHPLMRYTTSEQLVINPGSVGEPFCDWSGLHDDLRAEYCILECDEQGMPQVSFRKVSYDRQKEIRRAENARLPYLDLYSDQLYSGIVHTHDHELLKKSTKNGAIWRMFLNILKNWSEVLIFSKKLGLLVNFSKGLF